MSVVIRVLGPPDAAALHAVRLRGLRESPDAFGSTLADEVAVPLADVAARYGLDHGGASAAERVVLGAFDDDALVGMAGGTRERYAKASHRASVWGMFVVPEQRGRGVGGALLDALIAQVRAWPGVEQVELKVVTSAAAARAVYVARGFRSCGVHPDAYRQDGRSFDVEEMVLRLDPPG